MVSPAGGWDEWNGGRVRGVYCDEKQRAFTARPVYYGTDVMSVRKAREGGEKQAALDVGGERKIFIYI